MLEHIYTERRKNFLSVDEEEQIPASWRMLNPWTCKIVQTGSRVNGIWIEVPEQLFCSLKMLEKEILITFLSLITNSRWNENCFPSIPFTIKNYSFPVRPNDFVLDFAPGI